MVYCIVLRSLGLFDGSKPRRPSSSLAPNVGFKATGMEWILTDYLLRERKAPPQLDCTRAYPRASERQLSEHAPRLTEAREHTEYSNPVLRPCTTLLWIPVELYEALSLNLLTDLAGVSLVPEYSLPQTELVRFPQTLPSRSVRGISMRKKKKPPVVGSPSAPG